MTAPTAPKTGQATKAWIPAAVSALIALALYAVTLGGVFIYDDLFIVGQDARVHDPHLWWKLWTGDYFSGGMDNLYRPLVSQSYALQWWLTGNRPWAFHLVNILLNAGVCACVAELGRRLGGWRAGLIGGILFAVMPVHVEAVTEIVGRADLMCALGMIGAAVLFLRWPMTVPRALAIGGCCVLALLSKESGLLLPGVLAALWPARRQHLREAKLENPIDERQAMQWVVLIVCWTVAGLILLREEVLHLRFEWDRSFLDWILQPLILSRGWDRALIPFALLGRYLQLMVAPMKLSIDYGAAVLGSKQRWDDPYLWLGFIAAAGWWLALVWSVRRRQWAELFCLLALALTYAIVSNAVLIGTIFGERLIYLPSAFFVLWIALLLSRWPAGLLIPLVAVVAILGCIRSYAYAREWNNRESFYFYSLKEQPRSVKIHLLAGQVAMEEGDFGKARAIFQEARDLAPTDPNSWNACGLIEETCGNDAAALGDYLHAFSLQHSSVTNNKIIEVRRALAQRRRAASRDSDGH